jgi:hypothetical protein
MEIEQIKKDFINVLQLRKNITSHFEKISNNIDTFKQFYKDMIKMNAKSDTVSYQHSIFGIDAFLFQHKIIEMEYANIVDIYKIIDNRIYYEHNKLYKMVQEYTKKEFTACADINKPFPEYKILDTTKEYDISHTIEMQSIIVKSIIYMLQFLEKREVELKMNKKNIEKGINIDNLIHIQNFHNSIIKSNVEMFSQYLHTFNNHHTQYLTEIFDRSVKLIKKISKNIRINHSDDFNEENKDVYYNSASEVGANEVDANSSANEVDKDTYSNPHKK